MELEKRGWGRVALAAFATGCASVSAGACTQLLGLNPDRHLATDAQDESPTTMEASDEQGARGDGAQDAAAVSPWDCLDNPPQLFNDPTAMTMVTFIAYDSLKPITSAQMVDGGSALDLVTYTPLPSLEVRACASLLHPNCDMMTATPYETTDDAGLARFTLPQNFNGFYQFNNAGGGLFTTSYYPGQLVSGVTTATVPGIILTSTAEMELERVLPGVQLSHDPDGGVGHIIMSVLDCHDHSASGVQFSPSLTSSSPPTIAFYTRGKANIPSTTASETDPSGAGGLLNVPTGLLPVRVTIKATGQELAVVPVFVNPGVAASVHVRIRTR